jgi:hypothetical protein
MKYAVEMGSGAMIYIPSFTNVYSAIRKLISRGYTNTQTHRQHEDRISLISFLFFKIKKIS